MPLADFEAVLNKYLSPSSPVRREELLKGRTDQLKRINRALASTGRNVFIYGDRGVGKSSVAQTAAYLHQSSDAEPIILACDSQSNVYSICYEIASRVLGKNKKQKRSSFQASAGWFLSYGQEHVLENGEISSPKSLNEAVSLIQHCCKLHSTKPTIIIDEFDRIDNPEARRHFGDFIKQLGDQNILGNFIFCGVSQSLDTLLASHESCFRYLSGIELNRLDFNPRMEIIQYAANAFSVTIDKTYLIRIAHISDGFPHFIHLIGFELFWALHQRNEIPGEIRSEAFTEACRNATQNVEATLRQKYQLATEKYRTGGEYEHVLWALSDHPDLRRPSAQIFESYTRITSQLRTKPLDRRTFNNRLNSLKKDSHGKILTGTRQGWYEFTEPVIRGYCRLRAELAGVTLDQEHYLSVR